MEENKKPICCFCGKECEDDFGNNPYPANTEEDARCCNECNSTIVIPERIRNLQTKNIVDIEIDSLSKAIQLVNYNIVSKKENISLYNFCVAVYEALNIIQEELNKKKGE